MASLRVLKKDIDYLVNEVVSDCYVSTYFHPEKKDEILKVIEEAVALRNNLFERANNPAEKHNKSLVKKHYAFLRTEMFSKVDDLFGRLSELNK